MSSKLAPATTGITALVGTVFTVFYFGLLGPASSTPGKSGPRPDAQEPAATRAVSDKDAFAPFHQFWDVSPPARGAEYVKALPAQFLDPAESDLEFLVATVPDPIDTRFGYRFDSILDDVQMAIESQGWNLDHFWLPWMPGGEQPGRRVELAPVFDNPGPGRQPFAAAVQAAGNKPLFSVTGALGAEGAQADADPTRLLPRHHRDPGVLLFRKPRDDGKPGPQQILILFLIGESPTTGIHKIPMSMTFDIIRGVFARRKKGSSPIRIVGPTFSGSERSLSYTIKEWSEHNLAAKGKKWPFVVRSGGATRVDKKRFESNCGGSVDVRFDATVFHHDDTLRSMLGYLKRLNGGSYLGRIAILTESDTAYGQGLMGNTLRDKGYDVTEMKFPFHISQVAVAYDQNRRESDKTTPSLIRPSNKLRIPFDEIGSPRDVVPSLSPAMTSATDEFVTARILDTISKEHYRYVGILATDTRDTIFLAGLVRDYCPDVQLFIPSGDLLLGHPEYAAQLRGTIVASTYPLFSIAQRWDPPHSGDRRRHLFSHESDQGFYNATLSLLGERNGAADTFPMMYDYGRPFDEMDDIKIFDTSVAGWMLPPSKPGKPRPAQQPALWFGVVGQRGLWPVGYHVGAETQGRNYVHQEHPTLAGVDTPAFVRQFVPLVPQFTWQWGTLFALLTISILLLGAYIVYLRLIPRASPITCLPFGRLRPDASRAAKLQRDFVSFLGAIGLLAVYYYVVVQPCQISAWDSAWRVFLHPDAWVELSGSDRNNWNFGLFAIATSYLSVRGLCPLVLALLLFVLVRLSLRCLQKTRDSETIRLLPERLGVSRACRWVAEKMDALLSLMENYRARWFEPGTSRGTHWYSLSWEFRVGLFLFSLAVAVSVYNFFALLRPSEKPNPSELSHPLLYFERAVNLGNGVSPLVPVLVLAVAASAWVICQLRRIGLCDHLLVPRASDGEGTETAGDLRLHGEENDHAEEQRSVAVPDKVSDELIAPLIPWRAIGNPLCWAGFALWLIVTARLWMTFVPTVDGPRFNLVMILSICALMFGVIVALSRFVLLWLRIKQSLAGAVAYPGLREAFERIPDAYARLLGRYLDASPRGAARLAIPVESWEAVRHERSRIAKSLTAHPTPDKKDGEAWLRAIAPEDASPRVRLGVDSADDAVPSSTARDGLRKAARACVKLLNWDRDHPLEIVPHDDKGVAGNEPKDERSIVVTLGSEKPIEVKVKPEDKKDAWKAKAEDLVAIEFITSVHEHAVHLRNLAWFLGLAPVLLIVAATVYPFQPQRFLIVALGGLLATVVAAVIGVYVQMDRDDVLSRVSKTTPEHLSLDRTFVTNILAFLVPLIGFFVAQFPSFSDTLYGWFEPLARSLK